MLGLLRDCTQDNISQAHAFRHDETYAEGCVSHELFEAFEEGAMFRQQTEQAKEVFDRLNVQLAMQGL